MAKPLRALLVEDSPDDAELVLRQLRRGGFDVTHTRVQSAAAMREALGRSTWDAVLSDDSMPGFSASAALKVLHESGFDLPFIIVSGTIEEETAVGALRGGAHDFLVKERLARLVPAIERETREAKSRADHRAAQKSAEQAQREKVQAQAATEAKSHFLAMMSHELRTPLNSILGFSELLELGEGLSEEQRRFVDNVLSSGRHLLGLINDILDLSKIAAGRMAVYPEATSVAMIAGQVRNSLEPLVRKRGLDLTVAVPPGLPPALVEPVRLKQILYNLLSNAIKFTPSGGAIRLAAQASAGGVEIAVMDTGPGIPEADLPRLFREFEQLGQGHTSEGTGLGLALTRKLVELHGGSIAVESKVGEGTVFRVQLPVAVSEPEIRADRAAARVEPDPATVKGRILVVEDDPGSRRLVRAVLELRGHEVFDAETVEEACAVLADHSPQLVLTDIRLPGGGGVAVLAAVRAHPSLARVPVLATTAEAMHGDRERLLAQGFDGYLSKPIDTRELGAVVESFLAGRIRD